jgi:hypothetical protein
VAENRNPAAAGDGGSEADLPSGTIGAELSHCRPLHQQRFGRIWGRRDLAWYRDGDDWVISGRGGPLFRVVPDGRFAGMWRVVDDRGGLSDLANLTRARDAAASLALATLNRQTAQGCAAGTPRTRESGLPAAWQPQEPERTSGAALADAGPTAAGGAS